MYFSAPDLASQISHLRNSLQLPPSAAAMSLAKDRGASNAPPRRDHLDLGDLTDDLKIPHGERVPDSGKPV